MDKIKAALEILLEILKILLLLAAAVISWLILGYFLLMIYGQAHFTPAPPVG